MQKPFWESRELWVVFLGLVNFGLNRFGLPSFEPTPEFHAALLVVIGGLRAFFTKTAVKFRSG